MTGEPVGALAELLDEVTPEVMEANRKKFELLAKSAASIIGYELNNAEVAKIAHAATKATKDFHYGDLIILGSCLKYAGEQGMAAKAEAALLQDPDAA